jgi:2-methylcitrate dehydratase PrpD
MPDVSKATATAKLACFIADTKFEDLPDDVVNEAKRIIMDAIACQVVGLPTEIGDIVVNYIRKLGGNPQATVFATGEKTNCVNAAYANGKIGNALDYDDVFPTITHFGEATVAAGLALCETENRSGKDLITAIAVGYEVAARVSLAFGGIYDIKEGKITGAKKRHGSSRDDVFGATGAAANALKQPPKVVSNTLGIAGGMCPVPTHARWGAMIDLPLFKYWESGWCAQTGVAAALLAGEGYTGYENIFDGDRGFYFMYGADSFDPDLLTDGLGKKWYLSENVIKLWPCCRYPQYPLTVLKELTAKQKIRVQDIDKITVGIDPHTQQRRFSNQEPKTLVAAQFSYPHAISVFLHGIPRGPKWQIEETRNNPSVAELRRKVFLELDPRTERMYESFQPGGRITKHPCSVEIINKKGEKLSGTTDYCWGDGSFAPKKYRATDKDIEDKFREAVTLPGCIFAGKPEKAEKAIDLLWSLEKLASVRKLTQIFAKA